MLDVLQVTFPFFALVLCGYLAARRRLLPLEAIPGLNGFVLFFALPCMLFRFGSSTPIAQLLDATVFLSYLLCALVMVALSVAVSLNARIRWKDASLGALVGAFPNTGFMGVPLLVALLGSAAAGPAIVTITVDMVITTSLCLALSEMDAADEHGAAVAARKALWGVLRNPLPWAIVLGGVFSWLNLELAGPVVKTVALLGSAAAGPTIVTILVDMVITTSLCLALAEWDAADEHGVAVALRKAWMGMLKNPMPWAISLGAVFSWQNLELVGPVAKTVGLLGDAASPVALFTIGAVLARSQMLAHQRPHGPLPLADYLPVALFKLLLHPVLVWCVASTAQAMGVPLQPFALMVMVLVAALPSASNVSLLAERIGADNGRIARIILVTTAAAFLTFSAAVALLKP